MQGDQGVDAFLGSGGENSRCPLDHVILNSIDARLELRLLQATVDGALADAGVLGGLSDRGPLR